jgi:hypothetical protein
MTSPNDYSTVQYVYDVNPVHILRELHMRREELHYNSDSVSPPFFELVKN